MGRQTKKINFSLLFTFSNGGALEVSRG